MIIYVKFDEEDSVYESDYIPRVGEIINYCSNKGQFRVDSVIHMINDVSFRRNDVNKQSCVWVYVSKIC